jgi:predicted amidophosphoribosyltransferase
MSVPLRSVLSRPGGSLPDMTGSKGMGAAVRTWGREVLELVLPLVCPGCHVPGAWCRHCAASVDGPPRAVMLTDRMLDACTALGLGVPAVYAVTRYSGPARAAIIAGKERGRRDLPAILGVALGRALQWLQETAVIARGLWLVPAPTRRSAARARGGDPVLAMARSAARHLAAIGRPTGVAPCLGLARGARDSVGLDAAARTANLTGRVRYRAQASPPPGAEIVLVDDVLTTGATVIATLRALAEVDIAVAGVLVVASVLPLRPAWRAGGPSP